MGSPADIRDTLLSRDNLPAMPEVLARIWQMADDPKVGAQELAEVIKFDPALVVQIFKLVNSAQFSLNRTVGSVRDAITLLGTKTVKNLTITLLVKNGLLPRRREPLNFNRPSFWRHCVGTAFCAETLARGVPGASSETAYVAGLLHDVGIMTLDSVAPEELAKLVDRARDTDSILESERELFGCTHCDIGRTVLECWGLSSTIVEAIAHHHYPLHVRAETQLTCIVAIADAMMSPDHKECYSTDTLVVGERVLTTISLDEATVKKAQEDAVQRLEGATELLALAG